MGFGGREGAQQNGIHHREDRGVGADTERQREDRHGGKNRGPGKCREGKAQIGQEVSHVLYTKPRRKGNVEKRSVFERTLHRIEEGCKAARTWSLSAASITQNQNPRVSARIRRSPTLQSGVRLDPR